MLNSSLWKESMPISSGNTFRAAASTSIALIIGAGLFSKEWIVSILLVILTLFTYFLVIGFVARYFQCYTEFKTKKTLLIMGILSALILPVGVIIPGKTIISNTKKTNEETIIRISGLAVLAITSVILLVLNFLMYTKIISWVLLLFLFPAFGTDGEYFYNRNKFAYFLLVIISTTCFALSF